MAELGVDPRGIAIMEDKFQHFIIRLFKLSFRQAAIIKQEMLARGADAAVAWKVCSWDGQEGDGDHQALLAGTLRQLRQFAVKLRQQPFGLAEIGAELDEVLTNYAPAPQTLVCGNQSVTLGSRTLVMGIINLTPDSFSQDGLYRGENYIDAAIRQARQMVADGADLLDVGAESTRPNGARVSEEEEGKRLLPALKELLQAVEVPISVDTYKPGVAEQALNIGPVIINDIWGFKSPNDPERRMARVAGDAKAPVILMHNQAQPGYRFLMQEIVESLGESITIGLEHGVVLDQIIVDPGIGFGKAYVDNLKVLQNMDQLKSLGRPILLGVSRKSVVGLTLDLPVEQRLEGTIAATLWGVTRGADMVRVHDVKAVARAVKMVDAIIRV